MAVFRRRRVWRLVGIILGLGLVVSLLMLWALTALHEELTDAWLRGFDSVLTGSVHGLASPGITKAMSTLSVIGSATAMVPAVGLGFVWLARKQKWPEAAGLVIAVGGGSLLNTLLKTWFQRPRPTVSWAMVHEASFSFPSGHAMVAIIFYGMLAYLIMQLYPRYTRVCAAVAGVMVLGIGLSRVYLGVHYPSDILAGFGAGAIWLGSSILSTEAMRRM